MGNASGCNSILKSWDRCGGKSLGKSSGKTSANSSKIDWTGGAGVFGNIEGSSGLSRRAKVLYPRRMTRENVLAETSALCRSRSAWIVTF
jgi:hypothetical protein